jgi:hypothetical protein
MPYPAADAIFHIIAAYAMPLAPLAYAMLSLFFLSTLMLHYF